MTTQKMKDHYSDDVRLAILEETISTINTTLVRFEKRFDQIDAKFDKIDAKFDQSDAKFDKKFDRIDTKFDRIDSNIQDMRTHFDRLISGLYVIFGSSLIAVIVKLFIR